MKFLSFLVVALISFGSVNAQHTIPRFSTDGLGDNTFRNQKLGYRVSTDLAQTAIDSLTFNPNSYQNHIALTVNDSCVVFVSPATAWVGDRLVITISKTAGAGIVRFSGRGAVATPFQFGSGGASIALTASKLANIQFIFNGVSWVEVSRMAQ